MKADELLVRCYAERKDGQWRAFCLDFDLAAQADTCEEVRAKLDAMLDDYVAGATRPSGLPRQPAALRRRTPLPRRRVCRRVPFHHQNSNPNHSRLGFFIACLRQLPRVLAGSFGVLRTSPSPPLGRFGARFSLYWPFLSAGGTLCFCPKSAKVTTHPQ